MESVESHGPFYLQGFKESGGIPNEKELAGVLTFVIFKLVRRFYADKNWYGKMDAEKVCASALDEFKRRFLHPYEDKKILENGDVE